MSEPTPGRPTILLVDDNVNNLKVAVNHLRRYELEILTARSGEAGLERARLAQPDLILLDVQLPGMDGFETCRSLKRDPTTREIPVIFMTVLTNVEDKMKGFEAGGVDYVPKPFEIEELMARVNAHLKLYHLQRALQNEIAERQRAENALRTANLELQRLAVRDGLTQVANRRRFDQFLSEEWGQAAGLPLALLLCDVDHFKGYNDHYGHPAGDEALRQVAQALQRAVNRDTDLVARYGGEEFAVILPATDAAGAQQVAQAIQAQIAALRLPHAASPIHPFLTISLGGAISAPAEHSEAATLVAQADDALYQAKSQGRNCTVMAQGAPRP